jgi:hypothetical protein
MGMSPNRTHVSLTRASQVLETTEGQVKRLASQRLIGTQRLPGLPTRYSLVDITKLKERCTVPAMVESEDELVKA